MKKTKKALLAVLSSVFIVSASLGIASCSDGKTTELTPVSITKISPEFAYIVGDSVHMFDHFEYVDGLTYSFTVSYEGEDAETVKGTSFYLKSEGEYTITCTVTNGKETKTENVAIFVGNKTAFMQFKNHEATVEWNRSMWDTEIIALAQPITIVDCEYETYIDSVVIYDGADGSGRTVKIEDGVKIQDEAGTFYNGADRFTFVYECDYLFSVVCETTGGKVSNEITIKAKENFDNLQLLSDYSIEYDKTTYTATWDAVDGASSYYVKVDRKQTTITGMSINIEDMLVSEFQYFDLHVVPLNASGERMGKLVYEDVVIAPEGSDGLVKGLGATVDSNLKTATLMGKQATTAGYETGIRHVKNSYVAFGYKYGIGTYIDFEFTGNNLPQLCFFANEINANMTCDNQVDHLTKPNEGYLLMNGLAWGNAGMVSGADALICVGPYRFSCNSKTPEGKYIHGGHTNYIVVSEQLKNSTVSKNSLLTYNGLKEAGEDKQYKYTVGTFVSAGKLAFDIVLRDGETDAILETARFITATNAEDVKPGHIIAYAGVKGDGVNTTFTYGLPYKSEPDPEDGVTRPDKNDPYSVILKGKSSYSSGWSSGVAAMANSYIGIKGEYGVGTYIDFIFTGNNLPQVTLFANEINANMSAGQTIQTDGDNSGANTGFILTNGLHSENPAPSVFMDTSKVIGENKLLCLGPYRIGNHNYRVVSETSNQYNLSVDSLFTQQKLREDTSARTYKYTVGSQVNNGMVEIVVFLYDNETNELLVMGSYSTGMTKTEIEALGGNIIIYACVKGADNDTVFKYTDPYESGAGDNGLENVKTSGAVFNGDGSVVISPSTGYFATEGYGSGASAYNNNYIAFEGEYGVGTVTEYTFKGNNMPQVMLFADNINGCMGAGYNNNVGGNGYLITNGIYAFANADGAQLRANFLYCYGPTRIKMHITNDSKKTNFTYETGYEYTTLEEMLDADTTYKYVVWSEVNLAGKVDIRVQLFNVANDTLLVNGTYATGKTEAEVETLGGNIVAYAGVKGAGVMTMFTYKTPYPMPTLSLPNKGAILNTDGSVTLTGIRPTHAGYGSGVGSSTGGKESSYIAFEGEYGVGTYIDVEFTGNNMPYIMFFADGIDGYIGTSSVRTKGLILTNGFVTAGNSLAATAVDTPIKTDRMMIWGPNGYRGDANCAGSSLKEITDCAALTQDGLNSDTYKNMKLRYTVGTYTDGTYVGIHISLYNRDTNQRLYDNAFLTTVKVSDVTAGNIILFAPAKGLNKNATFSYSDPYTKQAQ